MKKKFRNSIDCIPVYSNNQVDLVHDACKICWDQKSELTTKGKLNYIAKRVAMGHESVLEHSNIIMMLCIEGDKYLKELTEILPYCKYINVCMKKDDDGNTYVLLGGSIRGFKHIFREATDLTGIVLSKIKDCLYELSYKEFFVDFIEAGIMNEFVFIAPDQSPSFPIESTCTGENKHGYPDIVNADPLYTIQNFVNEISTVPFSIEELLGMCSITILFNNMSRTATHQLVRHRNGITQESQRYVDYSNAKFISPDEFVEEYADNTYKLNIFGNDVEVSMKDLGSELMKIYGQLRDQGVKKQDARAFLPSNVACGKLYMTFTFKSLIKFLDLRTDSAAQSEIRYFASAIEKDFKDKFFPNAVDIYKFLIPKYMLAECDYNYDAIDEVIF